MRLAFVSPNRHAKGSLASPLWAYRRQVRRLIIVPGLLPREVASACLTLMVAAFAIFENQTLFSMLRFS